MEDKYQEIYKQLKDEAKSALEQSSTDKFIEEFKNIVKERMKEIHQKLDNQRDKIIDMAMKVYNKEIEKSKDTDKIEENKPEVKKEESETKKEEKPEEKKEEEISPQEADNKLFKSRIKGLVDQLNGILTKSEALEETVSVFKNSKLNQLLDIKENDFVFKHERKLQYRILGKVAFGLGWSDTQNKPGNSDIDKDDASVLNVHANSCYNYYITDKIINDETVVTIFETDIAKSDGYLYFGVTTKNQNHNSYCMCCTCAGVTYIRSSGYIVEQSKSVSNQELNYSSGSNIIEIKVCGKEKEVYFKVNDKQEQGPYTLPGEGEWVLTSGSCNSANGKIKILSSIVIG